MYGPKTVHIIFWLLWFSSKRDGDNEKYDRLKVQNLGETVFGIQLGFGEASKFERSSKVVTEMFPMMIIIIIIIIVILIFVI